MDATHSEQPPAQGELSEKTSPTSSPLTPHSPYALHENPNHAAVSLDVLDPSGVHELRRTYTRKSQKTHHSNASSDLTLADFEVGDGPFDFEKFLRNVMKA